MPTQDLASEPNQDTAALTITTDHMEIFSTHFRYIFHTSENSWLNCTIKHKFTAN